MDVFGRLAQTGRIHLRDKTLVDRERRALAALANWASDCMEHDDVHAHAYEARMLRALDDGETVDRLTADIGTDIERAGKPSVAGLAGMIFARAMQADERPPVASSHPHPERRRDPAQFKTA